MYENPALLALTFIRFASAFLLLYVLIPIMIFPQEPGRNWLEYFFINFSLMVFLNVIIGYLLVLARLYEVISLLAVYLAIIAWRLCYPDFKARKELVLTWLARGLDVADGVFSLSELQRRRWQKKARTVSLELVKRLRDPVWVVEYLLLLAVVLVSAYLRFRCAFVYAAPATSDSSVTLAWMKYIDSRVLFHDGIYPQGFSIYLSIIQKFSAENALYVLKYAGPLDGLLITVSIYYFMLRMTGNRVAALVAMFVYGVMGPYLPLEFIRQSATNSMEFGDVFLLPAILYAHDYLTDGRRSSLIAFLAAAGVIGLVNALSAVFFVCGLVAVLVAAVLTKNMTWQRIKLAGGALIGVGLLWLLPVGIGLAMGKSFNGSAADYATSTSLLTPDRIVFVVWLGLFGAVIGVIYALLTSGEHRIRSGTLLVLLLNIGYLLVNQSPRFGVESVALIDRSHDYVSQVTPLGIGLAWHVLTGRLRTGRVSGLLASLATAVVMVALIAHYPLRPADPYTMQWDAEVVQYLRIAREYQHYPSEWLMVSQEEGYDLALGTGFHLMTGDWLGYDPSGKYLVYSRDSSSSGIKKGDILKSELIFVFNQKKLFVPDVPSVRESIAPELTRQAVEEPELTAWLAVYERTHPRTPVGDDPGPYWNVYYEDDDIQVIAIYQPLTKEERFLQLWGIGGQ